MRHRLQRYDGAHPDTGQVQVERVRIAPDVWDLWVGVVCGRCGATTAEVVARILRGDAVVGLTLRGAYVTCDHCGAEGRINGRDRRALQRTRYDRDAAALDRRDVLEARAFLARHVPRGDQGLFDTIEVVTGLRYWSCPRCTGVDAHGRPVGRRPRAEYDCWRCGWSHYDAGMFVAHIDGDRFVRGSA